MFLHKSFWHMWHIVIEQHSNTVIMDQATGLACSRGQRMLNMSLLKTLNTVKQGRMGGERFIICKALYFDHRYRHQLTGGVIWSQTTL